MRQVPHFTQFALIGGGRIAQHLSYYLESLGLPFWVWTDARNLTADFFEQLTQTSHVLLLVSDSAIAEVALRIRSHSRWLMLSEEQRPVLVHASGATTVEGVHAAHPLMTFPEGELYPKDFYRRFPIVVFSDDPAFNPRSLLPEWPNPFHVLPVAQQGLYHALCVVYGNLPQLLWTEAETVRSENLHLPREAFRPFMEVSLQNFLRSPEMSLTGPFIRKDLTTIQHHLDALADTRLLPLYSGFVDHFVDFGETTDAESEPETETFQES